MAATERVAPRTSRRPFDRPGHPAGAATPVAGVILAGVLLMAGPSTALGACPPGTDPDRPGPVDGPRPSLLQEGFTLAFDRVIDRVVLVTQPDPGSSCTETWTFDVCTNTWARREPTGASPMAAALALAHDASLQRDVLVAARGTYAYDAVADAWSRLPDAPGSGPAQLIADPSTDGVLLARVDGGAGLEGLWRLDPTGTTWSAVTQVDAPDLRVYAHTPLLAYDTSVDRVVMVMATMQPDRSFASGTWVMDPWSGGWSVVRALSRPFEYGGWSATGGEIAYDEAARRTVVFDLGVAVAYDAARDRWELVSDAEPGRPQGACSDALERPWCAMHWHHMAYDPINRRLVVVGIVLYQEGGSGTAVIALDVASGTWTTLVAPERTKP